MAKSSDKDRKHENDNVEVTQPVGNGAADQTIPALAQNNEAQAEGADVNPDEWNVGDVVLDTYEVLPVLEGGQEKPFHAGGGMGKVYKMHHNSWDLDMAVKVPRAEFFSTQSQKANFVRECHTWMDLGLHPHVVTCFYVRVLGGIPCVFAEYLDGGSLKDWIASKRLYEGGHEKALERIINIAIQFARGLDYAHDKKIIHQDVKPANLMMAPDGSAKVADFGLANARAGAGETISSNIRQSILATYGGMTPAYCSPEQANKEKLSRRTDIWSWGLSALEMFTGEVTWMGGQAAAEALEGYLDMGIDDDDIPTMPDALAELLKHCFERNPDDRPKTMGDVAGVLQNIYQTVTGNAYPHEAPTAPTELADVLNNKALSFLELGMADPAEKIWQDALKLDPHHLDTTYNYGLRRWRTGTIDDASLVMQLEEAKNTHGKSGGVEYLLGLVHLERWDAEAAITALQEAEDQSNGDANVAKALALAEEGKRKGIVQCVRTFEGHSSYITSVAISPDGQYSLSGSGDKTLKLWELESGRCIHIFEGHSRMVLSVAISPDGQHALSGSGDKTLKLWNIDRGQCVHTFEGHSGGVTSVAFSPDAQYVLSGSWDKTLKLWELDSGKCMHTFDGHTGAVLSIAISPDGQYALSGSHDHTLKLWDLGTGKRVRTFEGHSAKVTSVAISPDGQYALSGSSDHTLKLWELGSGQCVRTFEGHGGSVCSVAISPNGKYVLSGSSDKTLKLWETGSGQCVRTFEVYSSVALSIAISPDGQYALSGSDDNMLKLWEIASIMHRRWNPLVIYSAVVNVTEALFQDNHYAQRLTALEKLRIDGDIAGAMECLQEARRIPGRSRTKKVLQHHHALGRWCQSHSLVGGWLSETFEGHSEYVSSVAISPDGQYALSGSSDHTLKLWELGSGQCVRTFEGHNDGVDSVAISPDGQYVLSGSKDKTLKLWELSRGKCVRTFEGHNGYVYSVAISPDGRYALSGSWDKTLKLWELDSGKCVRTFEGHNDAVDSVAISPDGQYALSGSHDNTLKFWDLGSGRCVRTFGGHSSNVRSIAISPDCQHALSGSSDKTLKLWELDSGQCVRTFEGHSKDVISVAISPDGQYALSGCFDKTLKLWDLGSGKCVRTFEAHSSVLSSVTFNPDGQYAFSGSADKTLKLWELDWEYAFPGWADWDDGAQPWLTNFLTTHCPYGDDGISRIGKPEWNDDDFNQLLHTLGCAGYGWLRPEGVRKKLEEMTANWQGPPPFPGTE